MDPILITAAGKFRMADPEAVDILNWFAVSKGIALGGLECLSMQQVLARLGLPALPEGFPEADVMIGGRGKGGMRGWLDTTVTNWLSPAEPEPAADTADAEPEPEPEPAPPSVEQEAVESSTSPAAAAGPAADSGGRDSSGGPVCLTGPTSWCPSSPAAGRSRRRACRCRGGRCGRGRIWGSGYGGATRLSPASQAAAVAGRSSRRSGSPPPPCVRPV